MPLLPVPEMALAGESVPLGVDAFEMIACGTLKAFVVLIEVVVLISVHLSSKKSVLHTRSRSSSGYLTQSSIKC